MEKNMVRLTEYGDTRRGAYMKGRALGRRLANVDTSTMQDHDLSNLYGQLGMKDQYDYENASDWERGNKMDNIRDRYCRLKRDDEFFGDWQRHIDNGKRRLGESVAIRLTESDLHRIIMESVNSVLNEVKFGGESFHGDNPDDWATMSHIRHALSKRDDELAKNNIYKDSKLPTYSGLRNRVAGIRDTENLIDTAKTKDGKFGTRFADAVDNGRRKVGKMMNRHFNQMMDGED